MTEQYAYILVETTSFIGTTGTLLYHSSEMRDALLFSTFNDARKLKKPKQQVKLVKLLIL